MSTNGWFSFHVISERPSVPLLGHLQPWLHGGGGSGPLLGMQKSPIQSLASPVEKTRQQVLVGTDLCLSLGHSEETWMGKEGLIQDRTASCLLLFQKSS